MLENPVIYYIKGFDPFSAIEEKNLLKLLTAEKARSIQRLVFPKDRSRSLYGLLLIRKILADQGIKDFDLQHIEHIKHEKPLINLAHNPHGIDFNISHSGEVIVGTCISNAIIGIDTEILQNKQHKLSSRFMTKEEMAFVGDSEERFLSLWTQKEALIKVDPKGRLMQLKNIQIDNNNNTGRINNRQYHLHPFKISKSTFTHIACSKPIDLNKVIFKRISPQDIYLV